MYGPGTWYDKNSMIAKQCIKGEMNVNDGITSFIHVKDAINATVQAIEWEKGIYNIVDDTPVKNEVWGPYYAEYLNAPQPNYIQGKTPWERGASNQKAKNMGWKLLYPSWKDGFLTKC